MAIQIISSDGSIITEQLSSCQWDITVPVSTENNLLYGGVVTWLQDYDFYVSPAGYYINGVFYESPEAYITLSPSDPSLDRFDVIYVDADQVVKVLEGDPSITPAQPGLDLGLQVGLGVIFVEAGSSSPVDLTLECLSGWTTSGSDGDIDMTSANANCVDATGLEVTNGDNGDYALWDRGTTFNPSEEFNVLTFRLRPKGDWSNDPNINHRIKFQWYLSGIPVASAVYLGDTGFNFSNTNLACQIISIPVIQFGLSPSMLADQFRITVVSEYNPPSYPFGFYLDGLCLQGGIFGATESDDIHNQYFGPQTPGRYWIQGNAKIEGWVTSPDILTGGMGSEKFGWGARVTGSTGTAIGAMAQANGQEGATAVGNQAVANVGVAVGFYARSNRGVSVGGAQLGSGGVAVGGGSQSLANSAIAIGDNTIASGLGSISMGGTTSGFAAIGIGNSSNIAHNSSIGLGTYVTSTADRQFIIGGHSDLYGDFGVNSLYFGSGIVSQFNYDKFWTISGSEGTNTAGDAWYIAGAKGTGTANGGPIYLQTSDATVSGTTLQSLSTKVGLNSNTLGFYLDNTRFQMDEGTDVVAAGDLTLNTGNSFTITGNTSINAITTTNWQDGAVIYLLFTGTPTVFHNTAGGANTAPIRLAGATNFSTTNNTVLQLQYKDGYWREVGRTQASAIGPYTFLNGIHEEGGGLVKLGGTLIENTTITGNNNYLRLTNGRFQWDMGTDTLSANDLTLPADGNVFSIGGTTTINAITTSNWQAGSVVMLLFDGVATVKHNTAGNLGTASILLNGGVDLVTDATTVLTLVYNGNEWEETSRKSEAVGSSGILSADSGLRLSTATNVQLGAPTNTGAPLLQTTYVDLSSYSIAFTDGGTVTGTVNSAILGGDDQIITGHSSVAIGGANTEIYANGAVSVGTDGHIYSTANYGFIANDANDIWGESAVAMNFGNDVYATCGFAIGSSNMIGGTANQYSNSFVGGSASNATGTRAFAFGEAVTSTGTNTYTFGQGVTNATAQSFAVGFNSVAPDFIITEDKIRINSARFQEYKGADVASANDLTLGTDGNTFTITGVTQINAITSANWQAGSVIRLLFNTIMTVKHNTAGGGGTAPILLAGATDVTTDSATVLTLVYNGTAWEESSRKFATGAPILGITADNGLTANTTTNVRLGGTLIQTTTVNTGGFQTNWTGSNSGAAILNLFNNGSGAGIVSATTGGGTAGYFTAQGGTAVTGEQGIIGGIFSGSSIGVGASGTTDGAIPLSVTHNVTTTNTNHKMISISRTSSGTPVAGIGAHIQYDIESDGNTPHAGTLGFILTDVTNGTEDARFELTSMSGGAVARKLAIHDTGQVTADKYGVGSFTSGTAAYLIATDASGNFFEYPSGGITGGSLVTADNGLSILGANNVQLGAASAGAISPLLHNTYINVDTYWLQVRGNNVDILNGTLNAYNTGGATGLYVVGSGGTTAHTNAHLMRIDNYFTSTNTVEPILQIARSTSAGADGIGGAIEFRAAYGASGNNNGTTTITNRIASKWVTAGVSQMDIIGATGASAIMSANSAGVVGIGIATGYTATRLHTVDAATTGTTVVKVEGVTTVATPVMTVLNSSSGHAILGQASGAGYGVFGTGFRGTYGSGSGVGAQGDTTSGTGVKGVASTGLGAQFITTPTTANDVTTVVQVAKLTSGNSGNGQNGVGGSIDFHLPTSTSGGTVSTSVGSILTKLTDATHATRTTQLDILGTNSAASTTIMSAHGSGVVGIGIASSYTATRLNVVDNTVSSGSIVNVTSTSTAAASGTQKGIAVSLSGTNANSNEFTYGIYSSNTHAGTGSLNYGIQGVAGSGASVNVGVQGTATGTSAVGVGGNGTGWGGQFTSSSIGVQGISSGGYAGLFTGNINSATGDSPTLFLERSNSGGASADGIAQSIVFALESSAGTNDESNRIVSTFHIVNQATRTSSLRLTGMNSGSSVDMAIFHADGSMKLRPITAAAASAITPAEGMIVIVSDTNGTFTSIGFWGYSNAAWAKF